MILYDDHVFHGKHFNFKTTIIATSVERLIDL